MHAHTDRTAVRSIKWLGPLLSLALLTGTARAADRLLIPDQLNLPLYSRGLGHTGSAPNWVVMAFYRPLACVPRKFNLLDSSPQDIAADCPLLVEGFAIVGAGSPTPTQVELQNVPGEAVPVCFTRGTEWLAAVADGTLTVRELTGLPSSLIGWADFYQESLSPPDFSGNFQLIVVASGRLEDGRPFFMHAVHTPGAYEVIVQFGE